MSHTRQSGILLHPTSLPGPDGIGDLGPECYRWIEFLHTSGCKLWQILPLGPTGYGDSPYQCFSAFAGNPYLISPVLLLEEGLLTLSDLGDRPDFPADYVDFGPVIQWKLNLLDRAFNRFQKSNSTHIKNDFSNFCMEAQPWLDDYAAFMAIKEALGGGSWNNWPVELRVRESKPLALFVNENNHDIEKHKFRQFLFHQQWSALKSFANAKGIQIIGDIPIYVAYDSADAWSNPGLFLLAENSKPVVVAGVPPDYFSPTGQLWGNPIYKWEAHKASGYAWWIERIRKVNNDVDIIRMDHFRGFAGYYEVPANLPTAEIGRWEQGPGISFIKTILAAISELSLIAEDLGVMTQDVLDLRDAFQLPGMKVLQFAFGSTPDDPFLPHNYPVNCVAYTGTHDNDTTVGWYTTAPEKERDFCRRYFARSGDDIAWDLIRAIWCSPAIYAIATLQDFLRLGTTARMNFPGNPSGNWIWRYHPYDLDPSLADQIKELNTLYSR